MMGFWNKAKKAINNIRPETDQQSFDVNPQSKPSPADKPPSEQLLALYASRGYKVIPEPVPDSDASDILDRYESFPASLVPKSYMNPVTGDILRGDIVLLWWLGSRKNIDNKPKYFLYRYGINTDKTELKLVKMGLLNADERPTPPGNDLVAKHHQIIRQHRASYSVSPTGRITYQYSDAELAEHSPSQHDKSGKLRFKSSGDFIKDQSLGESFIKLNDLDNAMEAYKSAEKLAQHDSDFPTPPPGPLWGQARILHQQKDYKSELRLIKRLLKYYPNKYDFEERKKQLDKLLSK